MLVVGGHEDYKKWFRILFESLVFSTRYSSESSINSFKDFMVGGAKLGELIPICVFDLPGFFNYSMRKI